MSLSKVLNMAYQEQLLDKLKKNLDLIINEKEETLGNFPIIYEPTHPNITIASKLFRTKKYKAAMEEYQDKLNKFNDNNQKIKEIKEKYKLLISDLEDKIKKVSKELELLQDSQHRRIDLVKEKFRQDIRFNNLGIPIIDDSKSEIVSNYVNEDITDNFSMNDIMMVHATKYFPKDLIIKTAHDSNVTYSDDDNINTIASRNTLHFALNGKVSSHAYGNWDSVPLIILEPISNHINQMACIKDNDSFTYGSLKLSSDAIMLINSEDFDRIYQEHHEELEKIKENIVIFQGDSEIVVQKLLILLGYKPQEIGMWSWMKGENAEFFYKYVKKNYPNKLSESHSFTNYSLSEKDLYQRDKVLNSLRNETNNYFNGGIISLNELYLLFNHYKKDNNIEEIYTDFHYEEFLKRYGIRFHDNEIHIFGYKKYIEEYDKEISSNQIEKLKLLLKKYELLQEYNKRHPYVHYTPDELEEMRKREKEFEEFFRIEFESENVSK